MKEFKNYESPNAAIEKNKKKLKRQSSISILSQGKSLKALSNKVFRFIQQTLNISLRANTLDTSSENEVS